MKLESCLLVFLLSLPIAGCGSSSTPGQNAIDARDVGGEPVTLPRWMLEDVQPQSPRVGQTYGLDTFTNKIIVVSLLEGF